MRGAAGAVAAALAGVSERQAPMASRRSRRPRLVVGRRSTSTRDVETMPTSTRYNDGTYRKRAAALKRKRLPCWVCGRPIDYEADWKSPQAFTADHVKPIAHGGHLYGELRAAHRGCNSRRGAGNDRPADKAPPAVNSRRW